jgi:hypothetical protein
MKGLIFIPDITGFTNFVKQIDIDLGVRITRDLLTEIIDNNELGLELSEIEGDAVLFCKVGKPVSLPRIFKCFNKMYEAFNSKYQYLRLKYNIHSELTLKFILHYGDMNIYYIKGFRKLYGQTIIESHRLLKNGSDHSSYMLITEDYINALHQERSEYVNATWGFNFRSSQFFPDLREISYYLFHYTSMGAAPVNIPSKKISA